MKATRSNLRSSASRRTVLKGVGAGAAALAMPNIARAQAGTIKIGYLTPATGPQALFGETDGFTVERVKALLADGLDVSGERYNVEIFVQDSQSNSDRSAEVAADLILNEGVHLLLPASTEPTIASAADQAELYETPCISTAAPWQAVILPRGGGDSPFNWTYHFFWGLGEALNTFVGLWGKLDTNKTVGMMFPRNADGEAWGSEEFGLPPLSRKSGYEAVVPGFFELRTSDYSAQIAMFKEQNCELIAGLMYPDDFKTFVNQCSQQGYHPKVISMAAALLFPSGVEALGDLGEGMSSEVWWTPEFPFKSSLTGQVSREVADEWETATGRQWTQPLGYSHALWEVAIDALQRSGNPLDKAAIRDAVKTTNLTTLAGPVNFATGPHPNVSTTAIFGGQWKRGEKWMYDLAIVDNSVNQLFEPAAEMTVLPWAK